MPKRKNKKIVLYNPKESIFTKPIFYAGVIAILVLFYLAVMHINDADVAGSTFGYLSLLEALMCMTGLFLTDLIRGHGFPPRPFKELESHTFTRSLVIFMAIAVIQLFFQMIPLTARTWEVALAIVFASVSEELFFRAFLISIFIKIGYNDQNKVSLPFKREISYIEIMGITISAFLFAFLHINYYNDLSLMLTVFVGGLLLGGLYWFWRDLTANVIAHFILNAIVVGQSLFLVSGL